MSIELHSSSLSHGDEAKRRMVGDQASRVTPVLRQTEVSNFPEDKRVNGDEVVVKANGADELGVISTPKPARKIDPRVLQLRQLQVLLVRGSVFKCTICGRILVKSTLSDANRHCLREHSVNIVQYFKMASAMSDGELSIINIPVLFHSDSSVVMLLNCHFISQDLGSTPACSSANSAGILTQRPPPTSSITFQHVTRHPGKSMRYKFSQNHGVFCCISNPFCQIVLAFERTN